MGGKPHGVVTGHLASGLPHTTGKGSQRAAGAAQVPAMLKKVFSRLKGGLVIRSEKKEVAGHAVQLHDSCAMLVPDIA